MRANDQNLKKSQARYQQCTFCIMDTSDPLITFNEDGRCNHCLAVDRWKAQGWNPSGDSNKLDRLLETVKSDGKGRDYDVVLGLSGGVDSSYIAYLCKQWDLRTLIVHVDTGWNSELAVKNIENLISYGGFDLDTLVVDWDEMRDLQLAFFRAGVPNQDIPQDHAISAGFLRHASRHNVKWTFIGTNYACEGILPTSWGYDNTDVTHILDIHRRFGTLRLKKFPLLSNTERFFRYRMIWRLKKASPLNLLAYNKLEAIRELEKQAGWRYYGGKHYESRFTKFFQGWYLPNRWGYDKRLAHLASLVASGQLSRQEALHEFATGVTLEYTAEDRTYMANKLAISEPEFDNLMQTQCHEHFEYRTTSQRKKKAIAILNAIANKMGL
ncbi:MAG: N-acetyl sugar amidotransferase [Planctomycetaceae bacterium]|nr:N-acetyl sugar amidotransferase [Planctomycetaceae bacterium]